MLHHSSWIRGLRSTKCYSEMLFRCFFFISCNFNSLSYECPDLCWHKPKHSYGKNIKLHELKNEKNFFLGFSYIITNFEVLCLNILLSANPLFLKSDMLLLCDCHKIRHILLPGGSPKLKSKNVKKCQSNCCCS